MIKPLFDNVVLKKDKEIKKTDSGILLSTKEEESKYATVVAVSNGTLSDGSKIDIPFKVGDKVFYKGYSHTDIKDNGQDYIIVSLKDIICVIE